MATLFSLKSDFAKELSQSFEPQAINTLFKTILEKTTNYKIIDLLSCPDKEISQDIITNFKEIAIKLKNNQPLEYIINSASFLDLELKTNSNVLIPRPETEELVLWILENINSTQILDILDIGTGSACIPISIKIKREFCNLFAIDISDDALNTAKQNIQKYNLNINLSKHNILDFENENIFENQKFDIIVSNPPYVRNLEKKEMKANVLDYEPHIALFVDDNDPLIFYRRIAEFALKSLKENGKLFFEINQYLSKQTIELLQNMGFKTQLKKDLYQNDRMIMANL